MLFLLVWSPQFILHSVFLGVYNSAPEMPNNSVPKIDNKECLGFFVVPSAGSLLP